MYNTYWRLFPFDDFLYAANTFVDDGQMSLRDSSRVYLFKLEFGVEDYAVLFHDDYCSLVRRALGDTPLADRFIEHVLQRCKDVSLSRDQLAGELRFKEEEIA